jgi:hypothetical protein
MARSIGGVRRSALRRKLISRAMSADWLKTAIGKFLSEHGNFPDLAIATSSGARSPYYAGDAPLTHAGMSRRRVNSGSQRTMSGLHIHWPVAPCAIGRGMSVWISRLSLLFGDIDQLPLAP